MNTHTFREMGVRQVYIYDRVRPDMYASKPPDPAI